MRMALIGAFLAIIGASLYIAAPFYTAWQLREAIRTGDSTLLERKVEWDSVRTTLKASLIRHGRLVPEVNAENDMVKPGLWQRVKMAFGQSLIDSFVERYVTPTGLPQLFEVKRAYHRQVRRESDDDAADLSRLERFKRFWARLKRAEFQSLSRIEIEVEDRRNPERLYVSVLELRGYEWKLTGLMVKAAAVAPVRDPIEGLSLTGAMRAAR